VEKFKTAAAVIFLAAFALMVIFAIVTDEASAGVSAGIVICAALVWLIGKLR